MELDGASSGQSREARQAAMALASGGETPVKRAAWSSTGLAARGTTPERAGKFWSEHSELPLLSAVK